MNSPFTRKAANMDGSTFYRSRPGISSSSSSRIRNTPPSNPRNTTRRSETETPLTSRSQHHDNAMASSLSACQEQLAHVLRKLEETNGALSSLSDRIDRIEQKLDEQSSREEQSQDKACGGKRKRTKDSLTIQVYCICNFNVRVTDSLVYRNCLELCGLNCLKAFDIYIYTRI